MNHRGTESTEKTEERRENEQKESQRHRPLFLFLLSLFLILSSLCSLCLCGSTSVSQQPSPRLLLAFSSFRERPRHPKVYFYEHDGVGAGKIAGFIEPQNQRSDYRPSLSLDGRLCAIASELENQTGRIQLWDLREKKFIELPAINETPNAQMGASLSADAKLLAFAAWNRPGASQRWDVFLYDVTARKLLDLPGLNSVAFDERMPALSGDGRFLAYTTNAKDGVGLSDVMLYDRRESKAVPLPGMNAKEMDVEPALNGDGSLLAFVSDRPGGSGGRDVYLYDRTAGKLLPLPGLNSVAQEQSPSLSADGRLLAFVSERIGGEGERDVYLYDRQTRKLLPTPGLNARQEDFDPCVIGLHQP